MIWPSPVVVAPWLSGSMAARPPTRQLFADLRRLTLTFLDFYTYQSENVEQILRYQLWVKTKVTAAEQILYKHTHHTVC